MLDENSKIRNHKPSWTSEELEIIYKNYTKKTLRQLHEMLPNRSFCAVKNKVKRIKYGKYKKQTKILNNSYR